MNLQEQDFSADALDYAVRFSDAFDRLAVLIKAGINQSPEIDKILLGLLVVSRKLLDYIAPLKSTGEIFGLPKAASDPDRPEPIIFRADEPNIDFGAWWHEKTSRIHKGLFQIAMRLATPQDELTKDLINLNISEIQHIIGSVIDLLNSGGLVIREIRIGDEDDDEEEQDDE
jgi:hypothetical protein